MWWNLSEMNISREGFPDMKTVSFTSPQIAKEAAKVFKTEARTMDVQMRYKREVESFVRKIETAHKRAAKSKLVFKR